MINVAIPAYTGKDLRQTSMKPAGEWFEFLNVECPICSHKGYCAIHIIKGKPLSILCMRESSFDGVEGQVSSTGQGTLFLISRSASKKVKIKPTIQQNSLKKANADILDKVYRIVLSFFALTEQHRETLIKQRKLSTQTVDTTMFGSYYQPKHNGPQQIVSGEQTTVWAALFEKSGLPTDIWKGVPGFSGIVNQNKVIPVFNCREGLLVPYRNQHGQIVGLQTREDHQTYAVSVKKYPNKVLAKAPKVFVSESLDGVIYYRTHTTDPNAKDLSVKFTLQPSLNSVELPGIGNVTFEATKSAKYLWVSTANKDFGTASNTNLNIAEVGNSTTNNRSGLASTFTENGVFVTEGGLKSIVIAEHLSKVFKERELNQYGKSVIGIPGVSNWNSFVKFCLQNKIYNVTCAFDMDFLTNKNVKESYSKLISALLNENIEVKVAVWDATVAKGLDDLIADNLLKPQVRSIK